MWGWSRVGCGGLGCTQLRLDGFGMGRVCLSRVEIGWRCVCVGLAGSQGLVYRSDGTHRYRSKMAADIHTEAEATGQILDAPTDHERAATLNIQFGFYGNCATVCITAVTGGGVGVASGGMEPQRDSRTSEADVKACVYV